MGRPTKKEVEKKNILKSLDILKRDSIIYTFFEERMTKVDRWYVPYYFSEQCALRVNKFLNDKEGVNKLFYSLVKDEKIRENIKVLEKIDTNLSFYIKFLLLDSSFLDTNIKTRENFFSEVYLNEHVIKNVFSKERIKEFEDAKFDGRYNLRILIEEINIKKDEKIKILNYLNANNQIGLDYKTEIVKNITKYAPEDIIETNKINTVYVEIDFTKPIEEIESFIRNIKTQFIKNPDIIDNPFTLLEDKKENANYSLKNSELYKEKPPKTIEGRLSDILFIYDCRKMGLEKEYAINEINRYWIEIKNIYKDKFYSYDNYLKIAKENIDKEGYKEFLSGFKNNPIK